MTDLPPLPTLNITSQETLRKCRELEVGSNDIFIASFPKSGTTWTQNIVYQLVSANREAQGMSTLPLDHISQYAPFFDIDAHWQKDSGNLIPKIQSAHEALGYRIFNTHLRWDMLPKDDNGGAKYIYLVRDGRDALTSFYHHMSNQHPDDGGFEGDFEAFFQQFLDGTIAYGKWSHHLASWMPHCVGEKNNANAKPQILLVRYEDLKADLQQQVFRIARFLELDDVAKDPALMNQVLERTSFQWMRDHQHLFHPRSVRWTPGFSFIRKGGVGDHSTLFDEAHQNKFMESVKQDFGGDHMPEWVNQYCYSSTHD
jgi:sulfotransferase